MSESTKIQPLQIFKTKSNTTDTVPLVASLSNPSKLEAGKFDAHVEVIPAGSTSSQGLRYWMIGFGVLVFIAGLLVLIIPLAKGYNLYAKTGSIMPALCHQERQIPLQVILGSGLTLCGLILLAGSMPFFPIWPKVEEALAEGKPFGLLYAHELIALGLNVFFYLHLFGMGHTFTYLYGVAAAFFSVGYKHAADLRIASRKRKRDLILYVFLAQGTILAIQSVLGVDQLYLEYGDGFAYRGVTLTVFIVASALFLVRLMLWTVCAAGWCEVMSAYTFNVVYVGLWATEQIFQSVFYIIVPLVMYTSVYTNPNLSISC